MLRVIRVDLDLFWFLLIVVCMERTGTEGGGTGGGRGDGRGGGGVIGLSVLSTSQLPLERERESW